MSDQVMQKTKEELAEEARLAKIVGISTIGFVPTNDNILVEGTAMNSCLGIKEKKPDDGKYFTFKVIGFGKDVVDLQIGDAIQLMNNSVTKITGIENAKSFESMTKMLKALSNKEYTELIEDLLKRTNHADIEFMEYFVAKRYAVLGIYTNDNTRNAINNAEHISTI